MRKVFNNLKIYRHNWSTRWREQSPHCLLISRYVSYIKRFFSIILEADKLSHCLFSSEITAHTRCLGDWKVQLVINLATKDGYEFS